VKVTAPRFPHGGERVATIEPGRNAVRRRRPADVAENPLRNKGLPDVADFEQRGTRGFGFGAHDLADV
jgi:hypothetical protein